ncbi:MAG: acyloxyacyl hydrolase [Nitrospinaceae bacterium]
MKRPLRWIPWLAGMLILVLVTGAHAEKFSQRFAKGTSNFGVQTGFGYTLDIPPGRDRSDLSFLFFFPNWQYNFTGVIGKSLYRGALFWHVEAGFASLLNRGGEYLLGFSPLMVQYKFLSPKRRWAPNLLLGAGFSYTNFKDVAERELGSEFEFLLNAGAGLEYFLKKGSISLNYRFFHISNAGIHFPNIGLNANVISLGFRF